MSMEELENLAYQIRRHALFMVHKANSSHIGGALSVADVLAVLYGKKMNFRADDPDWAERDRFVLSKGHCCAALYSVLALNDFFPTADLANYGKKGSLLMTHVSHKVPGAEWSTGSLGHGLGMATGQALAGQRQKKSWQVYVVVSDAELDEGSNWEAILFAGHHQLDNLTVIADVNGQQALGYTRDIMNLEPLGDKFKAFGWAVHEIDGHNLDEIDQALNAKAMGPKCIISRTTKGKGVSYMEDEMLWHYRAPKTEELFAQAMQELAQNYGRPYEEFALA